MRLEDIPSGLPSWVTPVATLLFGAGGAKMLSIWLENRRLANKDYRETLLEQIKQQAQRIQDLEDTVESLQTRQANLRETVGTLKEQNQDLSEHVERLERENHELRAKDDDRESSGDGANAAR